jgi:clorobiocin biosynthesis protein CloN4
MKGYWGRPTHLGAYRTGDLVWVREDGAFDFIGRRDHMVKVRGHRIEPGEIEKVLRDHPQVAEAAVVASTADGAGARLVAFVVSSGDPPGLLSLKQHCAKRLPRYMIVDSVVVLPELPRTRNGKTDRGRLLSATASQHRGKESDAI